MLLPRLAAAGARTDARQLAVTDEELSIGVSAVLCGTAIAAVVS